jgi:hypothetical protein
MNRNLKAVRYYDDGYRFGILVKDDEKRSFIIPIAVGVETRVVKYRTDLEEVVSEYFDEDTLKKLVAKVKQLGSKYGMTEEARKYLS